MRQSRQVRIACLGVLAALELLLSSLWTLKLNVITLWVKKTGPFLLCPRPRRGGGGIIGGHRRLSPVRLSVWCFEHNFGKYCPILIILSLLQTEIISYDNVYYKIYHHTSNLPVHYLAKLPCQRCWHDFVITLSCNSQTSHMDCNRYWLNQRCQFTSCTQNALL